MIEYASFCSGIEAPYEAWKELGFKPLYFSEIEPFPCSVLAHYHPEIPNIGDMLKAHDNQIFKKENPRLIIAGTPCQGFSNAGKRGGLQHDERAQLAIEFVRILESKRPQWFIWENVPGVFSSYSDTAIRDSEKEWEEADQSNDFITFISEIEKLGYGICWRVFDAQHFGVPQRRRRIWVVGYLGDWRPSARVLFEFEDMQGDIKKGLGKEQQPPAETGNGTSLYDFQQSDLYGEGGVGNTLNTRSGDPSRSDIVVKSELHAYSKSHRPGHIDTRVRNDGIANTVSCGDGGANQSTVNIVTCGLVARKLTENECGALQGFPYKYLQINHNGKPAKKTPQYKAYGNSQPVPVLRWIGARLKMIDESMRGQNA